MITATVDSKAVMARMEKAIANIKPVSQNANEQVADEVMRLSQMEVPHDEGTLQNSGAVETLTNGDVVLGYHTPYAARLHEHPEYRFQKGRKGKYIEDPIIKNRNVLGLQYGRSFQQRLF